ncbi:hypothetical protein SO802_015425 [Lithocarpus litseifolius]|uniref:Uncharacterized protein n=1 Tax=Lithocarpus litseifolius TaxID=425828 RepID=A0AAW2CW14_9ROSI
MATTTYGENEDPIHGLRPAPLPFLGGTACSTKNRIISTQIETVVTTESKCSKGWDLALASYYVMPETNLTFIAQVLQSNLNINPSTIVSYNKQTIANENSVQNGVKASVPFPCDCINGQFLGHMFQYTVHSGVMYMTVAQSIMPI